MLRRLSAGFTMIELLVVIAIIGVLAAAVLSAINPIEQINKGRDTALRSDASELIGAIERYYAANEEFPWNTLNTSFWEDPIEDAESEFAVVDGTGWGWTRALQDADEVKVGFSDRILSNADDMIVVKEENSGTTYVCFQPNSTQFRNEAINRCTSSDHNLPSFTDDGYVLCAGEAYGSAEEPDAANVYLCVPGV